MITAANPEDRVAQLIALTQNLTERLAREAAAWDGTDPIRRL